jgi:deoxyribodipyrimidine photo-lyase
MSSDLPPSSRPASAPPVHLVWLRRDLRLHDHAALAAALQAGARVHVAFVFDTDILEALAQRQDRRVAFIAASLHEIHAQLEAIGAGLIVGHGPARTLIAQIARELGAGVVHAARDYEPEAVRRDAQVATALAAQGARLELHKDQVVFETDEVLTASRTVYSVFTPYRNAWLKRLQAIPDALDEHRVTPAALREQLARADERPITMPVGVPSLQALGFEPIDLPALGVKPGSTGARTLIDDFLNRIGRYHEARNEPARRGPSYLSVHLRFGTVSVRELARAARQVMRERPSDEPGASTWLNELIWREFYFQILHHHPHSATRSFRPEFDAIAWASGPQAEGHWAAFRAGQTGYPLVDAAIAQILHSGYMHNRLRMVVASFLCKDLGLDWRLGERWFAEHLIDYDLSANAGGWQWAASSGCDAQPWFRIFNPVTQSRKFDPTGRFIRRYLPALARFPDKLIHEPWLATGAQQAAAGCIIGRDYPAPIVDHAQARLATLARYEVVRKASGS